MPEATTVERKKFAMNTKSVMLHLAVVLGAIMMLFPFLWTVITSITPSGTLASGPSLLVKDPTLDAYRTLFDSLPMGRIIANSLFIAVATTIIQLLTSAMAAYAFSRIAFKAKNTVFALYLATMMIPVQVLVVPLFIQMTEFKLNDTYASLIMPTIASAFGIFLVKQAMDAVPRDLDEAATLDGAGHLRIFSTMILPLTKASLATLAVFAFMGSWNSFLWPLVVIRSPEFMTLPLGLATLKGQYTTEWDVVMAGSVMSIIPIAIIYLFAQKHIIEGMSHTGLK